MKVNGGIIKNMDKVKWNTKMEISGLEHGVLIKDSWKNEKDFRKQLD